MHTVMMVSLMHVYICYLSPVCMLKWNLSVWKGRRATDQGSDKGALEREGGRQAGRVGKGGCHGVTVKTLQPTSLGLLL